MSRHLRGRFGFGVAFLAGGAAAAAVAAVATKGRTTTVTSPATTTTPSHAFVINAQAEAAVRDARSALEAYYAAHNGSYAGATMPELVAYAPTLAGGQLTLETEQSSYRVSAESTGTGNVFAASLDPSGQAVLSCRTAGYGACPAGGTWNFGGLPGSPTFHAKLSVAEGTLPGCPGRGRVVSVTDSEQDLVANIAQTDQGPVQVQEAPDADLTDVRVLAVRGALCAQFQTLGQPSIVPVQRELLLRQPGQRGGGPLLPVTVYTGQLGSYLSQVPPAIARASEAGSPVLQAASHHLGETRRRRSFPDPR